MRFTLPAGSTAYRPTVCAAESTQSSTHIKSLFTQRTVSQALMRRVASSIIKCTVSSFHFIILSRYWPAEFEQSLRTSVAEVSMTHASAAFEIRPTSMTRWSPVLAYLPKKLEPISLDSCEHACRHTLMVHGAMRQEP